MRIFFVMVLVTVLILPLAACTFGGADVETYDYDTRNYIEAMGDVTPNAEITEISVNWVAGSVRIIPGNVAGVTARETGVGEAANVHMYYRVNNNTLFLAFAKNGTTVRNIFKSLVVTVPQDKLPSKVKIDAVAATVNVEVDVRDNLEINSVSGRVECASEGTAKVKVDTVSAAVNLRLTGCREIELDSVSGAVNLLVPRMFEELEVTSESGAVTLTLPAAAGFDMRADTVSGKINTGDFACTRASGNHYICGVADAEIEVDTTSGNITLKRA